MTAAVLEVHKEIQGLHAETVGQWDLTLREAQVSGVLPSRMVVLTLEGGMCNETKGYTNVFSVQPSTNENGVERKRNGNIFMTASVLEVLQEIQG